MKFNQAAFDMIKPMPPFKAELRQANRENRKTQTRRVMKPQPNVCFSNMAEFNEYSRMIGDWIHWNLVIAQEDGRFCNENGDEYKCPYGYRTDLRYMREPLFKGPFDFAHYVDDKTVAFNLLTGEPIPWKWKIETLSQLYMPKIAARTFKRYDFIRAEGLKKISEEDAKAEGITLQYPTRDVPGRTGGDVWNYRNAYARLWDDINKSRGFGWDVNPRVWVIGYHDELQAAVYE
jgi:hypothetical protein